MLGLSERNHSRRYCRHPMQCSKVIRTVAAPDLEKTLHEMELSLDIASATCAHCGAVHLRPGLSRLLAFTCDECGAVTKLSDDPNLELFFGECYIRHWLCYESPQPTLHRVLTRILPDPIQPRSQPSHANRVGHLQVVDSDGELRCRTKRGFCETATSKLRKGEGGGFVKCGGYNVHRVSDPVRIGE